MNLVIADAIMSRRQQVIVVALGISALAAVMWVRHRADARTMPAYRVGVVERGTVRSTVSASGTLHAVRIVELGTQVSGQIAALYADFNSHVTKGQLLARIDPIVQEQAVMDAQAGVARAEVLITQSRLEYERSRKLHEQQIATDAEYVVAQSNYAVARGNLTSAKVSLQRARQNRAYTRIYSPIAGVVVARAMDVGQTVAARAASVCEHRGRPG